MNVLTFKNDTVSVGDVFVSSWGYEQTNVTFYQVLSVHGKKTVTVREIRANSEYTDSMVGFKTPVWPSGSEAAKCDIYAQTNPGHCGDPSWSAKSEARIMVVTLLFS